MMTDELRTDAGRNLLNRLTLKQKAVDYFGGACQLCAYDKCLRALEFHHVDRATKNYAIATAMGKLHCTWAAILPELRKCILLCANCHREVESGMHDLSRFLTK